MISTDRAEPVATYVAGRAVFELVSGDERIFTTSPEVAKIYLERGFHIADKHIQKPNNVVVCCNGHRNAYIRRRRDMYRERNKKADDGKGREREAGT